MKVCEYAGHVCTICNGREQAFPLRDSCASVAQAAGHLLENQGLSVFILVGGGAPGVKHLPPN